MTYIVKAMLDYVRHEAAQTGTPDAKSLAMPVPSTGDGVVIICNIHVVGVPRMARMVICSPA